MRYFVLLLILLLAPLTRAADTVIPLKLDSGGIADRDTRTFAVPVTINGKSYDFAWGCSGWTIVSESFAKQAGLKVLPDEGLASWVDATGQPLFAGTALADVGFADRKVRSPLRVLKDAYTDGKTLGTIGYDIAGQFQWELDPDADKPTLTIRPLGTRLPVAPLAVLPLTDDGERVYLNVTVRNVAFDLVIMPQASDISAGPSVQRKWDLTKGKIEDVPSPAGPVRTITLGPKEPVQLSKKIAETGVTIMLIGDPKSEQDLPASTNGIGASMLNRYVYIVDLKTKQCALLSRVKLPATQPAK
ncbi:hypothetical protein BH10PLA1_BH10PLA1_16500 [soil metagenome]